MRHHGWNQVFAKVVAGVGVADVLRQGRKQVLGIEHVHAHAGQCSARAARHGLRVAGFFVKAGDAAQRVDGHHAKVAGLRQGHFNAGHGAGRALGNVVFNQAGVVHFVHVVARQHQHIGGAVRPQNVQVLKHRVSRATVPGAFVHALLRGQQVNEFIELVAQKRPAVLQVAQQAVRLVLREHANAVQAGVEAVRQHKINDAVFATHVNGRLGAVVGQGLQPGAAPTRQHQGNGLAHRLVRVTDFHERPRVGELEKTSQSSIERLRPCALVISLNLSVASARN